MHSVINISNFNKTVPGSYEVDKLERVIFPVGIFFFIKLLEKMNLLLGCHFSPFTKSKKNGIVRIKNYKSKKNYVVSICSELCEHVARR